MTTITYNKLDSNCNSSGSIEYREVSRRLSSTVAQTYVITQVSPEPMSVFSLARYLANH